MMHNFFDQDFWSKKIYYKNASFILSLSMAKVAPFDQRTWKSNSIHVLDGTIEPSVCFQDVLNLKYQLNSFRCEKINQL